jgi:hypothetical protein
MFYMRVNEINTKVAIQRQPQAWKPLTGRTLPEPFTGNVPFTLVVPFFFLPKIDIRGKTY